jgi:hypothetical protein
MGPRSLSTAREHATPQTQSPDRAHFLPEEARGRGTHQQSRRGLMTQARQRVEEFCDRFGLRLPILQ